MHFKLRSETQMLAGWGWGRGGGGSPALDEKELISRLLCRNPKPETHRRSAGTRFPGSEGGVGHAWSREQTEASDECPKSLQTESEQATIC